MALWGQFANQYQRAGADGHPQSVLFRRWHYESGCVLKALLDVWSKTREVRYLDFVCDCVAAWINPQGEIYGYQLQDYNLDHINSGKLLFDVLRTTGDDRYRMAMETLIEQLRAQPQTLNGGLWHKAIYPNQMWLDGVYMSAPFMARYAVTFNEPFWFDFAVQQIDLVYRQTRDSATGLLYHAWDESRKQAWADPITGCSAQFWGRSVGWFMMALVDVLEFLPRTHDGYDPISRILCELSDSVMSLQDPRTGLWYQILDRPDNKGNYLESSCSSMFTYALAKGARLRLLPTSRFADAVGSYRGIVKNMIRVDERSGTVHLKACNAVAGLGGHPYRDGSLNYYLTEPVVEDDPKAVAAFIMASLEMEDLD